MTSATATASSPWIIDRGRDLAFIFGGAAASLLAPLAVLWKPELLPLLFWCWLLFFEGPHLWAAYSRTYIDRDFWRTDRRLLIGSLLVFVLPVAVTAWSILSGSRAPVNGFLLLGQGWAFYHIVRQHYGFVSIYDRKSGTEAAAHQVNKWALYIGLWAPYSFFVLTHPVLRSVAGLPPLAEAGWVGEFAFWMPITATAAAFLWFAGFHLRRALEGRGCFGPAAAFCAVCTATYSVIFYAVAPLEPFFGGARTTIQSFMLIAVMMSIFHNIQYHALVWHYNRRKYIAAPGAGGRFGAAVLLNRNFLVYILTGIVFAAGYVGILFSTTQYPPLLGEVVEPVFVPVAFCIWWGLLFHHYYLDQKIWRVSRSKDLQRHLEVRTPGAPA